MTKLSHNVTIQPRKALKSTGVVQLPVLSKWLNVTTEPMQNVGNFPDVHTIESYTTVKPGTKRVAIALVNNSGEKVTLKKGTKIGWLKAANVVPPFSCTMDEYRFKCTQVHAENGVTQ